MAKNIMTKERLKQYKAMQVEIQELKYKLNNFCKDDVTGNDVIMDYRKGYPMPQSVIGVDWRKRERIEERNRKRLEKLEKECEEIETFINDIDDSRIRCIFELSFIVGKTQKEVGVVLHLERSSISKKIDDYLQVSHKSQLSHV